MTSQVSLKTAPASDRANWITPEEQLKRLDLPSAKVAEASKLPLDAAIIIGQYNDGTHPSLTGWYWAHKCLKTLPESLPPLPDNMPEIMESKCPIYRDEAQANGTYPKVKDTHFLALIPKELGTLNQFEKDVLTPYTKANYPKGRNPLQFQYFEDIREEHADVEFPDTHWVLMTKNVLPQTRSKTYDKQEELVKDLSQKAFANYKIPTLQQAFVAMATHKVATGESLYEGFNEKNSDVYTFARVDNAIYDSHLAVCGSASRGMYVNRPAFDYGSEDIGVAALRQF